MYRPQKLDQKTNKRDVGIFMAKYSYEFKKQLVTEYLSNKISYESLANKYGIKASSNFKNWVKSYEKFGDDGLVGSRKNEKYTFDFKLSVVELYLTTEVSYQELALRVRINNPSMIARWVQDFRTAGPMTLREKAKGRQRKMIKSKDKTKTEICNAGRDNKYLKELEDENLKLRIELAYLKELRRLL